MINITSTSRNDATIKSFVCRTKCLTYKIQNSSITLREKCPYLELFWSVFCPNAGKYLISLLERNLLLICMIFQFMLRRNFLLYWTYLHKTQDSYSCFRLALFYLSFYFFFFCRIPSSSFCTVSDAVSFNTDEVLSINSPINVFVFGNFTVYHKDWLAYSSGSDRPCELRYKFSTSNNFTQMVTFPSRIPDCDSCSFGSIYFF